MAKSTAEELVVRELLKAQRATLSRKTSNGHEMWKLPSGRLFTCPGYGKRSDFRAWRNALGDLRRFLREDAALEAELLKQKGDGPPPQPKPMNFSDPPPVMNPVIPACFKKDYDGQSEKCVNCKHELACMKECVKPPALILKPKSLPEPEAETPVAKKKLTRKKWTDDDDLKILEMFEEGKDDHEIGKVLKRSAASIGKRRVQLGLRKRGGNTNIPLADEPRAPAPTPPPRTPVKDPPVRTAAQNAAIDIETVAKDGSPVLLIVYPNGRRIVEKISVAKANEIVLKILGGEL